MTEPVLADPAAMRARRHPVLITVAWAWFAVLGWIVAAPFHGIARQLYGPHPRGDELLFRPGAQDLLELALRSEAALSGALASATWIAVLTVALGQLLLAMAMTAIAFREGEGKGVTFPRLIARASRVFWRFLLVFAIGLVLKAVTVAVGLLAARALARGLVERWGNARAEQLGVAVALVFLLVAAVVQVSEDLSRAAIITRDLPALSALAAGFGAMRTRRARPLLAWGWRAAAGLGAVAAVSLLTTWLPDGWVGLGAGLVLHQLVIWTRLALRASWLAAALRVIPPPAPTGG